VTKIFNILQHKFQCSKLSHLFIYIYAVEVNNGINCDFNANNKTSLKF